MTNGVSHPRFYAIYSTNEDLDAPHYRDNA